MVRIKAMIDGTAELTISRVSGNIDPGRPYQIAVNDTASNKRILELRLTPEEFAGALTGRPVMEAKAEFVSPTDYVHVGKTAWHASLPLDQDFDGQGYASSAVRLENLVRDSALDAEVGGSEYRVGKQNNGLTLTVYGYSPNPATAVLDARKVAANLDTVATNGEWKVRGNGANYFPTQEILDRDSRDR
jgi:hypothetical protein